MKDFCFDRDQLKYYMELRRMNQKDLSERTGISKAAINNYVSGKAEPRDSSLEKIIQALHIELKDLDRNESHVKSREHLERIWKYLDQLRPDQLQRVEERLKYLSAMGKSEQHILDIMKGLNLMGISLLEGFAEKVVSMPKYQRTHKFPIKLHVIQNSEEPRELECTVIFSDLYRVFFGLEEQYELTIILEEDEDPEDEGVLLDQVHTTLWYDLNGQISDDMLDEVNELLDNGDWSVDYYESQTMTEEEFLEFVETHKR